MLKNYLKIAFRNLTKNKGYSFINIVGLGVGMAVAMLIGLWVFDELSFNKWSKNSEKVARVMWHSTQNGKIVTSPNMPFPLAESIRQNFPHEFDHVAVSWSTAEYDVLSGKDKFRKKGRFIQSEGAEILSLEMLKGSRDALKDPSSILISESTAKSIFNDTDPLGKIVRIDNEMDAQIAGVYRNFPDNSDYKDLSFVGSWDLFLSVSRRQWMKDSESKWGIKTFEILVQISPDISIEKASKGIENLMLNEVKNDKMESALKPILVLHPMSKWHLFSRWNNGVNTGGQITYVWLFGIVGIFVLLLACINFINLTTAYSLKRAKEVGIRKAVGSFRYQLIIQFFSESLLTVILSFLFGVLLLQLFLPYFNEFSGKLLTFLTGGGLEKSMTFGMAGIVFCLVTAAIAGSYPAFYLSGFKPVKSLKSGVFQPGGIAAISRKILVVVQFTVSITLIIGTIVVFRQIRHGQSRNIGYAQSGLINIRMSNYHGSLDALKADLLQTGVVANVAQSSSPATDVSSNASGFSWQGKSEGLQDNFAVIAASHDYGKTVGWQIKDGRDFSGAFASDSTAIILNETAAKYMGFGTTTDVIGRTVRWKSAFGDDSYTVVGVVKDMVMTSPYEPVKQTIYFMTYAPNFLFVRLKAGTETQAGLRLIENVFHRHIPGSSFDFKFADNEFALKFISEERIGKLAGLFAVLAIFISSLGLFGMASFMVEQRTKEIGIRKVLGASVVELWRLLSGDFVKLVTASFIISSPLAWYLMNHWLQNYQIRSTIPLWIFVVSGIAALIITIATVSFQGIKAALMDPVKSLRSD